MQTLELTAWLYLWRVKGVGSKTFAKILQHHDSISEFLTKQVDTWTDFGIKGEAKDDLYQAVFDHTGEIHKGVQQDLNWLHASGKHHILTWFDSDYPALLREINDAPPLLFIKGQPHLLSLPQLAVVGSRSPSQLGRHLSFEFSKYLADTGLVITSGMADGIDGQAHLGALNIGGMTVAVLAHGLDTCYPAKHQPLMDKIASNGVLVSEFPIGVKPVAGFFPRRNRLISGLSSGTLVIEAAKRSGSLITAQLALDQGRDVFAVPGSIHNPLAKGCHDLIKQGAKLVETVGDVIEEIAPQLQKSHSQFALKSKQNRSQQTLSNPYEKHPTKKQIWQLLMDQQARSIDEICMQLDMPSSEISMLLMDMELEGSIKASLVGYDIVI